MKTRVKTPKQNSKNVMFDLGSEGPEIYASPASISLGLLMLMLMLVLVLVLVMMLTVWLHSIRVLPRDEQTIQLMR